MALSNQIDLLAFSSPQKVNKKFGLISEDDLPRMVKSRKMTNREWSNPGIRLTKIGQIPAYDEPES
jgi:hypothetical protein